MRRKFDHVYEINRRGNIKNGQSREIGSIGYTRRRKTKHNVCWTPLCAIKYK